MCVCKAKGKQNLLISIHVSSFYIIDSIGCDILKTFLKTFFFLFILRLPNPYSVSLVVRVKTVTIYVIIIILVLC